MEISVSIPFRKLSNGSGCGEKETERGGLLATWLVRVQNHQAHVERDLIMFKAGARSHGSAHLKIFKTMKDKTS
ncbi:hypothetical protein NC651_012892 [Populus alba x Populus x berolinensis]|nr:hypothetical protein NC651_012892 [Populus alba x Populus x berolinensis]